MGYIADIWSVLRGRAVVVDETVEDSLAHLLLALEKRLTDTSVSGSIADMLAETTVSLSTILTRVSGSVAKDATVSNLGADLLSLNSRIPDGALQDILSRLPSNALSTLQSRVASNAALNTDMAVLLTRLTESRADALDNLSDAGPLRVNQAVYNVPGDYSWLPPAAIHNGNAWVTMIGGGGGGDTNSALSGATDVSASGGECGGYVINRPFNVFQGVGVTVGRGASPGTAAGRNGTASSFDSLTVPGGRGGRFNLGGDRSRVDNLRDYVFAPGGYRHGGVMFSSTGVAFWGGQASPFGSGMPPRVNANADLPGPTQYGVGGAAAWNTQLGSTQLYQGGAGGGGLVIVRWLENK